MGAGPHAAALEALGLQGSTAAALCRYLDLLAEWSPRVNLTGAGTPGDRVRLLVEPALPALSLVSGTTLLDVG